MKILDPVVAPLVTAIESLEHDALTICAAVLGGCVVMLKIVVVGGEYLLKALNYVRVANETHTAAVAKKQAAELDVLVDRALATPRLQARLQLTDDLVKRVDTMQGCQEEVLSVLKAIQREQAEGRERDRELRGSLETLLRIQTRTGDDHGMAD